MFEKAAHRFLSLCIDSIDFEQWLMVNFITVMGKAEGHGENWHGHVTALTVSPDYRRLGLAATLMNFLENVSEKYLFFSLHNLI